jgi:hypothetical protein
MKKKVRKTKKVRKIKHKGLTMLDKLPKTHGEYLELLIKMTERAMSKPPLESEKYLLDQADRLRVQLEQWKKETSNGQKEIESQNQEVTP